MNCMKCGRETTQEQTFCDLCLAEMEKYPVRPGTVILLPRRKNDAPAKKTAPRRKQTIPPEEQIRLLKRQIRRLTALLVLLLALLGATGYFTAVHLLESRTVFLPGQNYSTITDFLSNGAD